MRAVYKLHEGPEGTITVLSPFWRSLRNCRTGYAVAITTADGRAVYPRRGVYTQRDVLEALAHEPLTGEELAVCEAYRTMQRDTYAAEVRAASAAAADELLAELIARDEALHRRERMLAERETAVRPVARAFDALARQGVAGRELKVLADMLADTACTTLPLPPSTKNPEDKYPVAGRDHGVYRSCRNFIEALKHTDWVDGIEYAKPRRKKVTRDVTIDGCSAVQVPYHDDKGSVVFTVHTTASNLAQAEWTRRVIRQLAHHK